MTAKDFARVAAVLARAEERVILFEEHAERTCDHDAIGTGYSRRRLFESMVEDFAADFSASNPNFDPELFKMRAMPQKVAALKAAILAKVGG